MKFSFACSSISPFLCSSGCLFVHIYSMTLNNLVLELEVVVVGVANGKYETLRDGETSVFLCETETL